MQGGLWSACYYVQDVGWTCNQYKLQPEFIPAVQALAIITLLFYIVEFVVMVTVIILVLRNVGFGDYWNPKNISLVSSLVTFSAGYFMVRCVVINGEKLEGTFVNSSLLGIEIYYMDEGQFGGANAYICLVASLIDQGQFGGTTAYICLVASLIDQGHLGAITGNI
ncbi:unnamed protein product [Mytilus edulis]|uniref:Uncharacterized protein n=1 Tax=Mytilus edulis TaxID=6550 RepID=A0A8S3QBL3_MYTED|nr:unnamed protein product [Mytilus edulis]